MRNMTELFIAITNVLLVIGFLFDHFILDDKLNFQGLYFLVVIITVSYYSVMVVIDTIKKRRIK